MTMAATKYHCISYTRVSRPIIDIGAKVVSRYVRKVASRRQKVGGGGYLGDEL